MFCCSAITLSVVAIATAATTSEITISRRLRVGVMAFVPRAWRRFSLPRSSASTRLRRTRGAIASIASTMRNTAYAGQMYAP